MQRENVLHAVFLRCLHFSVDIIPVSQATLFPDALVDTQRSTVKDERSSRNFCAFHRAAISKRSTGCENALNRNGLSFLRCQLVYECSALRKLTKIILRVGITNSVAWRVIRGEWRLRLGGMMEYIVLKSYIMTGS